MNKKIDINSDEPLRFKVEFEVLVDRKAFLDSDISDRSLEDLTIYVDQVVHGEWLNYTPNKQYFIGDSPVEIWLGEDNRTELVPAEEIV